MAEEMEESLDIYPDHDIASKQTNQRPTRMTEGSHKMGLAKRL
jgi:hypothetical protein